MSVFPSPFPPNVLDALQQGKKLEAVKLLCEATGLGLKEAKDAIDQHMSGEPATVVSSPSVAPLPTSVLEVLQRGSKVEAIKLLREQTGLGLGEAKDWVDAFPQGSRANMGSASPGEVSRSGGLVWWSVALAVATLVAYYVLRGR